MAKYSSGFSVAASVGVKKSQQLFLPTNLRQRLFLVSQWKQRSNDRNVRNKNEEGKSDKLTFHHVARKKYILGYTDTAQLKRRGAGAVMNTAKILTAPFGIH